MHLAVLLCLAAFLSAPPSQAIEPHGERWAVVVGIDRYQDSELAPLQFAASDADAVGRRFLDLGFKADHIIVLKDKDATREMVLATLGDELPRRMGPNDSLLVYWSGHGITRQSQDGSPEGYLMTWDAQVNQPFATGIPMKLVRELADRNPAKHIFLLLDACYSGLAVPGLRAHFEWSKGGGYSLLDKYARLPSRHVLTAGQAGERALEADGHGLFTAHLLRALKGEADIDQDGVLAATELAAWMRARVTEASSMKQTPQYARWYGEGEYLFVVGPIKEGTVASISGTPKGASAPAAVSTDWAPPTLSPQRPRWAGPTLIGVGASMAAIGTLLYATGAQKCDSLGPEACNQSLGPRMGATVGLWGAGGLGLAAGLAVTFGSGDGPQLFGARPAPATCATGRCEPSSLTP